MPRQTASRIPNRWMDEFLANYLATAYTSEQPTNPQLEKSREIVSVGFLKGPQAQAHDPRGLRAVVHGAGFQNYGRDQGEFTRRAEEVYKTKKLYFLKEVKVAFPPHEKRPVPVDVSLERLEKISPGFLEWARQLAGGAR